jgi:hypothetical protein
MGFAAPRGRQRAAGRPTWQHRLVAKRLSNCEQVAMILSASPLKRAASQSMRAGGDL